MSSIPIGTGGVAFGFGGIGFAVSESYAAYTGGGGNPPTPRYHESDVLADFDVQPPAPRRSFNEPGNRHGELLFSSADYPSQVDFVMQPWQGTTFAYYANRFAGASIYEIWIDDVLRASGTLDNGGDIMPSELICTLTVPYATAHTSFIRKPAMAGNTNLTVDYVYTE